VKLRLTPTPLSGVVLIDIDYFKDERGFFIESWHQRDFADAGLDLRFVQEGHSRSASRVLRGLHYQDTTAPMGKLLRCTLGRVFDVAVDLRKSSPTFGQYFSVELSPDDMRQIYIPPGFAHGFQVLSDFAEVQYKQTGFYTPSSEGTIAWNDADVGVPWPIPDPIVSARDSKGTLLRDYANKPAFP
jgi:dTDP-4-dehydrorhamnose 3,5-epimerase